MNTPILQQQTRSTRQLVNVASPDTDSREIELNSQGLTVVPDLMHDHTRMKYTVPVGNSTDVTINSPVNMEDRTLHWLELDNSNNTTTKKFTFNSDHHFLDDLGNLTNEYIIAIGTSVNWFGTLVAGEIYWRQASIL